MAARELQISGNMHGLARKIGKIGSEHITFVITTRELAMWDDLVGATEGAVELVLRPAQKELGLGTGGGSDGADPDESDPEADEGGVHASSNGKRTPKAPKGRHAPRDERPEA